MPSRLPARIPVTELGTRGRPLVLLPGFGLTERTYRNTINLLAERRRTVFVPWVHLNRPWDYDRAIVAIQRILEQRPGPAVLVGHSFGGGVALSLAARRPDLVSDLVICSSLGLTYRWQLARNALLPGDYLWRMIDYDAAVDFIQTASRRGHVLAHAGWSGFIRRKIDEVYVVERSGVRSHVLWAERDLLLRVEDGRAFAEALGAPCTLVEDPDAPGPVDHDWVYRQPHLLVHELEKLGLVPARTVT